MTGGCKANAELLIDKGWKHQFFGDDAERKLVELAGADADWSLVPATRREPLFWTFRAAFLLGYSVEETIERAVAELLLSGTYEFDFGRNVNGGWLKVLWPLWRLARASAPDFATSAGFAWAFDSPLSILCNEEFSKQAKMGWGDDNFEALAELAAKQDENVLRDLHSSFKCARMNEAWRGNSSQKTKRFCSVIDFMGSFACKKINQTSVEYYYNIEAKQTVARNSSQEELNLVTSSAETVGESACSYPPQRRRGPVEGMSKTLKRESVWVDVANVSTAVTTDKTPPESKQEPANESRSQVVFESKQQPTPSIRRVAFEGPPRKNRGPVEGMSRTLKRESVWVEPPLENPVAPINPVTYPKAPPKPERETEKEPRIVAAAEPPVRGFLEWSRHADRLKDRAEEKRRLAEGIKPYEPIIRRKPPTEIALEVLRVVGLVLVGIIVLPIAWVLKVMFEPFFGEKEEKVYQKGEARLVDRVYLDKEHGVVAEIYMRRD